MKRSPKKGRTDYSDRMPRLDSWAITIECPAGGKLVALLRHVLSPQEEFNQKQSIHATSPFEVTVLGAEGGEQPIFLVCSDSGVTCGR